MGESLDIGTGETIAEEMEETLATHLAKCYHEVDEKESSELAVRHAQAEQISLSGSVAYRYEPLEEGHIRLISLLRGNPKDPIRLELSKVDFAATPPYCALSYVWGAPEPRYDIWVGHEVLQIGPNLHAALAQLRSTTASLTIWIDAIAINQSDNAEKSTQIPLMADLYFRAERVVAWLGEDDGSVAAAFNFCRLWARCWIQDDLTLQQRLATVVRRIITADAITRGNPMERFCDRPFFRRAWTLQEVSTASERPPIFLCGAHDVALDVVRSAMFCITKALTNSELVQLCGMSCGSVSSTVTMLARGSRHYSTFTNTVKYMNQQREAANPLDHIYAYRGLFAAPGSSYPQPDYDLPACRVFASYTRAAIQLERNLAVLSEVRPGIGQSNMPTWAVSPPPAKHVWFSLEKWIEPRYCATGNSMVDELEAPGDHDSCLALKGFEVDSIVQTWLSEPVSLGALLNSEHGHNLWSWANLLRTLTGIHARINAEACLSRNCELTVAAISECMTCNDLFLTSSSRTYEGDLQSEWAAEQFYAAYQAEAEIQDIGSPWSQVELCHHASVFVDSHGESTARVESPQDVSMAHWFDRTITRFFVEHVENTMYGRHLAVTSLGRLALVPNCIQQGDEICLLFGGSTPFVLRKIDSPEGSHTLVGDAYVTGIMYGEAYNEPGNIVTDYRLV
ncbi:hypothetical protein LTR95_016723 [Oleoguttula sp. CCFEE 5521]